MERVIAFLVLFTMNFAIQSFPIENGFSVKFNPISPKEQLKPRKFGALFAKSPQGFKRQEEIRREEVLNTLLLPQKPDEPGHSNQVVKLLFPTEYTYNKNSHILTRSLAQHWAGLNYLNLPIVRQPFDDYKVLVATAPPNVRLGGDYKQTFIYVVFPENGSRDNDFNNVPVVYFVNENTGKNQSMKNVDPVLIVDSNRTVTGIRSKEIAKIVSFKNKLSNQFKYRVT